MAEIEEIPIETPMEIQKEIEEIEDIPINSPDIHDIPKNHEVGQLELKIRRNPKNLQ